MIFLSSAGGTDRDTSYREGEQPVNGVQLELERVSSSPTNHTEGALLREVLVQGPLFLPE